MNRRDEQFTKTALVVIKAAAGLAEEYGHNYIGTEHLLLALIEGNSTAALVLRENGVEFDKMEQLVEQLLSPNGTVAVKEAGGETPRFKKVVANSVREAARLRGLKAGTEHLLMALIKETDCIAVRLLNTLGINLQKVYIDVMMAMGIEQNAAKNDYMSWKGGRGKAKSATTMLDQYSRDLTQLAREGRMDPVVGRDNEIMRLAQILSRRTKNNPCLTGDPGVGKTAVVEGLAQRIVEGGMPAAMENKRILSLDLTGMVAGTKYRGEFEERIKRIMTEAMRDGNVLLFIDEIHTIIGAGGAEGALDAANILKPALARGELQVIGATTQEEYRKHIEKDAALERRFQPVMVEQPTQEETLAILKGLRPHYEKHHQVEISDDALEAAVKLSDRYINDRFLPDKAIDLIDEAASRMGLGAFIGKNGPRLRAIRQEINECAKLKEQALKEKDFGLASEKSHRQRELEKEMEALLEKEQRAKKRSKSVVGSEEVAEIVSIWTRIPVSRLKEEEAERLRNLEDILHKRVIGQKEAVTAAARAIRRGRAGLKDPNRPIGSFLFLGPTGVGKTELSKTIAEAVFGREKAMIRVDMSEYMEKHSVSKMIGSPPGYVGYDEGGQLSERVRQHPYSVVLFDEIEKAHPDVFNILLQVLDEGSMTDSQGRKINFKNTIIIMTSNVGAKRIMEPKNLGFMSQVDDGADHERMKKAVMEEVNQLFKPEFLNRIDETIVFHALNHDEISEIVTLLIDTLAERMKKQLDIQFCITDEAKADIAEKGYDKAFGARPLRRAVQTRLEDPLSDRLLSGELSPGQTVKVSLDQEELAFKISGTKKENKKPAAKAVAGKTTAKAITGKPAAKTETDKPAKRRGRPPKKVE